MKKVSQAQCAFYKLYTERKKDPGRYVPTWEFGGEMFIAELNTWVLMSYKCPTRLTELFQENPGVFERDFLTGKSGSHYYGYRIRDGANPADLKDESLLDFYMSIKPYGGLV